MQKSDEDEYRRHCQYEASTKLHRWLWQSSLKNILKVIEIYKENLKSQTVKYFNVSRRQTLKTNDLQTVIFRVIKHIIISFPFFTMVPIN